MMASNIDEKPEELVCIPELTFEEVLPQNSTGNLSCGIQMNETQSEFGKWCIIQQWTSLTSLIHALKYIESNELTTYPQAILFMGVNYDLAFARIQQLRIQCYNQICAESYEPVENSYLLVQIFNDPSMISYEIIHVNFLRDQCSLSYYDHPVFGYVCLLYDKTKGGANQYMRILRISQNVQELTPYLYAISIYSLNANDNAIISKNVLSTMVPMAQRAQYNTYLNIKKQLLNTVNLLDERTAITRQQCAMIVEIMDQVRKIRTKLERKIACAEQRIALQNKAKENK